MREPIFIDTSPEGEMRGNVRTEHRDGIVALIRHKNNPNHYGVLLWKKVNWETFVTGGIEPGQTPEQAARAEVREETGYTNLRLVAELPLFHSHFFHPPKNVNRILHAKTFLFELEAADRVEVSEEEQANHDLTWVHVSKLGFFRLPEAHRFLIDYVVENNL